MKKCIALLLTGVMLLGLLSGCNTYQNDDSASSAGSTSNTADGVSADFTMAYNGVVTLNPIMSQSSNDFNLFYLTQIQLVRFYGDELQYDAAERYEVSDDYTVYTFHLRDGLKWSDGQALTAHDFEYGAYCLLNPDMGSPAAYSWFAIKNASAYNSREITDWAEVGVKALDDLTLEITPSSQDEIGDLAEDVDAMRLSIMDKLQREETAWRANTELITAISHDVRTPLTTLMGYLDILGENDNLTPVQQQEYLSVCRQKAEKLRTLTNELFSYFLVFGKPEPSLQLEVMDARTLLEQMLGEETADLLERDYQVQTESLAESRPIQVDVQHLRRIFDNLFSNVLKYADPARPVALSSFWAGDELHVCISNYVRATAGRVESTKIGLQTCEKLLTSMGGCFRRRQEAGQFTAEVILPAGCPQESI